MNTTEVVNRLTGSKKRVPTDEVALFIKKHTLFVLAEHSSTKITASKKKKPKKSHGLEISKPVPVDAEKEEVPTKEVIRQNQRKSFPTLVLETHFLILSIEEILILFIL
jgi:hypothetical protein